MALGAGGTKAAGLRRGSRMAAVWRGLQRWMPWLVGATLFVAGAVVAAEPDLLWARGEETFVNLPLPAGHGTPATVSSSSLAAAVEGMDGGGSRARSAVEAAASKPAAPRPPVRAEAPAARKLEGSAQRGAGALPARGSAPAPVSGASKGAAVNAGTASKGFLININTAGLAELDMLPGIGQSLAQRILDYRKKHGPFRTPEDLLGVPGIGPKKLAKIRPLITCGSQAAR
ncbi:MAG: helix-hairpin-helix domain-containing protein [Firmicutes bacterium]|nr:helix-hairpin-helix domain-containing protein [Bacillota bacterium]